LSPGTDLLSSLAIKSPGLGRGFLFDGFRADCGFVFDAVEQRNPAMPADESRERNAVAKPLIRASLRQAALMRFSSRQ